LVPAGAAPPSENRRPVPAVPAAVQSALLALALVPVKVPVLVLVLVLVPAERVARRPVAQPARPEVA